MYTITIGDKAYSSWSLRGWLLLAGFGLDFEEELVPMYTDAFDTMQAERFPMTSVPQLSWAEDGKTMRVWDSMAIAETLAERRPEAGIWPSDPGLRALARMLSAQMHSGFGALRGAAPMNLHREGRALREAPEDLAVDVDRVERLWAWAIATSGGPWLAGSSFSAADAFFAPVVFRLTGYALASERSLPYCELVAAHPAVARWRAEARANPRRIAHYDEIP
ncbi:MAG: glutathione S-transferase C-terminal domain-containing protein [Pseudomonadota bacterium]